MPRTAITKKRAYRPKVASSKLFLIQWRHENLLQRTAQLGIGEEATVWRVRSIRNHKDPSHNAPIPIGTNVSGSLYILPATVRSSPAR